MDEPIRPKKKDGWFYNMSTLVFYSQAIIFSQVINKNNNHK